MKVFVTDDELLDEYGQISLMFKTIDVLPRMEIPMSLCAKFKSAHFVYLQTVESRWFQYS